MRLQMSNRRVLFLVLTIVLSSLAAFIFKTTSVESDDLTLITTNLQNSSVVVIGSQITSTFSVFSTLSTSEHLKTGIASRQTIQTSIIRAAALTNNTTKHGNEVDVSDLRIAFPNAVIKTRYLEKTDVTGRCSSPAGRRILINYAANCCLQSQPKNCETGLSVGGFDVCIMFGPTSLDAEFKAQNTRILSEGRGAGFWLWKPYIVLRTLYAMRDDDVLLYADSGSHFIGNMDAAHVCLQAHLGSDISTFTLHRMERLMTKPDAFILMNVDRTDRSFTETKQVNGAFLLLRKTFRSVRFVSQWLAYAQDYRIIGNEPSKSAQNPPGFIAHRNDQSILSLLTKKWRIESWPDPTQWGESAEHAPFRQEARYRGLINKTFIFHSRNKQ